MKLWTKTSDFRLQINISMDLSSEETVADAVKDFFKQECNPSICKYDENFQREHDKTELLERNEIRPSFYAGLLAEDPSSLGDDNDEEIFKNSQYPNYPLCGEVASSICKWLENGCPFTRRISMPLLNEEVSRESREKLCDECEPIITKIKNFLERNEIYNEDSDHVEDVKIDNEVSGITKTEVPKLTKLSDDDDEVVSEDVISEEFDPFKDRSRRIDPVTEDKTLKTLICNLLCVLKERGILHLLGIRETAGSSIVLPPPPAVLLESFNYIHNEKSKLTVGARALSKHFHRCQTSSWWGDCKGTEAKKNQHATDVLRRIVEDCVWINIHGLPHDVNIIELR